MNLLRYGMLTFSTWCNGHIVVGMSTVLQFNAPDRDVNY